MTVLYRAAGLALGLAATAAIARGSHVAMTLHGSDQALLRLAWSARPERIERCRQQSEEELARLPAHMRQPVSCEGVNAQYRPLAPGDRRIEVRFDRVDSGGSESANHQSGGETVPAHLALDQRVRVGPREVILVTYSPERQALVGIQADVHPRR